MRAGPSTVRVTTSSRSDVRSKVVRAFPWAGSLCLPAFIGRIPLFHSSTIWSNASCTAGSLPPAYAWLHQRLAAEHGHAAAADGGVDAVRTAPGGGADAARPTHLGTLDDVEAERLVRPERQEQRRESRPCAARRRVFPGAGQGREHSRANLSGRGPCVTEQGQATLKL